MTTTKGLQQGLFGSFQATVKSDPARSLIILALLIFLAELFAMTILYFLQIENYVAEALLDGLMMLILIMPGLYYLQLSPLLMQIEERTRTEQALRNSEGLLRKVLELLPVGVWIIRKHGEIAHGNPASQKIWAGVRYLGARQKEERGGGKVAAGPGIEPEKWAAARAILRGETTLNEEIEIECSDGSRKIILNSALPILDEQMAIQGAIVVNQDITQRRQRERALVQTNELLEKFFSSIDTLIAYMDRDFNFIRVNDTYAKAGGHPADYFIGKNHFTLYPHEENQIIFQRVVDTGEPFSVFEKPFEYAEFPERGVTYWDWSLQPVKGEDGSVEGVVMSLVDVTERKRAEVQLERQNEEMRKLYKTELDARQAAETLSAAAQALTQTLDLEQVMHTLLEHIHGIVQSDTACVTLMEDETRLTIHTQRGYGRWHDREKIPTIALDSVTDSILGRVITERKSLVIPDVTSLPIREELPGEAQIRKWLVVPIIASDKVIGLVELGKAEEEPFLQKQIQWAEALVGQASVAIQNAWLFEQVRANSERLQSLAHKLVQVQENERYHIARELHDEAGQALASLKLDLGSLERVPDCPEHVRQQLLKLKGVADGVLEELHRLAMDLRPATLDHLGLVATLEQAANRMNSPQLVVQFKAVGFEGKRISPSIETSLYRIVQEALTNVVRYAQASQVGILLERSDGKVRLYVEDDGIGFETELVEGGGRLGLVGMRERAEMLGGNLTIESSPGSGTSIIVEVPDVDQNPHRG